MNAVAPAEARPVARWQPPALSQPLAILVDRLINPHHGDIGERLAVPPHVRVEAEAKLRELERATRPAGRDRLRFWLLPLNAAVSNPRGVDTFEEAVDALVLGGCADVAAIAVTSATQREAIGEWKFWPSAAEVLAFLSARAAPVVRQRDALRRLIDGEPPPEPMTDEQRAAAAGEVKAAVAALKAELAEQAIRRDAAYAALRPHIVPAVAVPLASEHLAEARRRAGIDRA